MITKGPWSDVRKWQRRAAAGASGVLGPGKPQLVFCASMADFFEDHPGIVEARAKAWDLIRECPNLHFQLLTKRPENIAPMLPADWGAGWPNVWLGASIEDWSVRERADRLREIEAAVRFISYEPALGPLQGMNLEGIDWVIYGGESGAGFRPDDRQWARDMRTQCMREGVAFFYKQAAGQRSKTDPMLDGERVEEFPIVDVEQGQQSLFEGMDP